MTPPLSAEEAIGSLKLIKFHIEKGNIDEAMAALLAACKEAVRNGPYDYVSIDEAEMKYKEAYEKGALEMRERAAKHLEIHAEFLDRTKRFSVDPDYILKRAESVRALPIAPIEGGSVNCLSCNGTRWVCENHSDREAFKCCGGAGSPCVHCNPLHPDFKKKRIYQQQSAPTREPHGDPPICDQ